MQKKTKISLFFNTKLVGYQLIQSNRKSCYLTPIMYPTASFTNSLTQLQVLIETIKSYSKISFNVAIFNLDFSELDTLENEQIEKVIKNNIHSDKLIINFTRASNPIDWNDSVNFALRMIGLNSPTLVVMNHDHLFVDRNDLFLNTIVDNIFNSDNDFGKILSYTHASELLSEALLNSKSKFADNFIKYESDSVNKASIYIMTIETLLMYLPTNINNKNLYIGRLIDWDYPRVSKFKLVNFIPFRELFKHYDGYGHVSASKFISDLRSNGYQLKEDFEDLDSLIKAYYQKWLDNYYLFLRDSLRFCNPFISHKSKLRSSIDLSFDLFKVNYLHFDQLSFRNYNSNEISNFLYSYIYYNILSIYSEISVENKFLKRGYLNKIYDKFNFVFSNFNLNNSK